MRLAFVIQRYGREVLGGAETLARQIAERLGRRHEIDVLTTTAKDYVTWKNEYSESEEKLRGVRIIRFPVEAERDLQKFNEYSDWIYNNPHSREDELKWLEMQGPVVPKLVDYLRREHSRYDLLVFFTYLYYPTFYGIQIAPEKTLLLPTAHDEPPIKLGIYREVFESASALIFNTEEEEKLVVGRFNVLKKMRETIGIGMDLLDQPDSNDVRRRFKLPGRYLLYAGRIDAGKGCEELVRYFRFFIDEHPITNLQLLFIGQLSMKLPHARDIRYLGFLDERDKLAVMSAALAVIVPSRYESLSIVVLEAFSVGSPVIVHSGSKVLVEHCRRSNGGLYYHDFDEFEQILGLLLEEKNLAKNLGKQGQRYIKKQFGWDRLLPRYEQAFRAAARPPRPGSSLDLRAAPKESVPELSQAEIEAPPQDEEERPAAEPATEEWSSDREAEPAEAASSPVEVEEERTEPRDTEPAFDAGLSEASSTTAGGEETPGMRQWPYDDASPQEAQESATAGERDPAATPDEAEQTGSPPDPAPKIDPATN